MPKYLLPRLEFYITNVCNLSCDHCMSFNNLQFKGHYNFDKALYQPWADKFDLESFEILGGEPMLNPNLKGWMSGLRSLWPNAKGIVLTNGTYLSQVKDLHKLAAEYQYTIKITAHSGELRSLIVDQIFSAFGNCELIPLHEISGAERIQLKTHLGVDVVIEPYQTFQISPFKNADFEFYNSDPIIAHQNCKISACIRIIDSKLYKCSLVATGPEFLRQQNKPIPAVLSEYKPISPEDITSLNQLAVLFEPMPACSLCKESNEQLYYNAALKNKKTFKIYNQQQTKQTPV